jgi:hypothetical protein
MPICEASVAKVKGKEKFDSASTGAEHIFSFKVSKAIACWESHMNESFLSKSCKGVHIMP